MLPWAHSRFVLLRRAMLHWYSLIAISTTAANETAKRCWRNHNALFLLHLSSIEKKSMTRLEAFTSNKTVTSTARLLTCFLIKSEATYFRRKSSGKESMNRFIAREVMDGIRRRILKAGSRGTHRGEISKACLYERLFKRSLRWKKNKNKKNIHVQLKSQKRTVKKCSVDSPQMQDSKPQTRKNSTVWVANTHRHN